LLPYGGCCDNIPARLPGAFQRFNALTLQRGKAGSKKKKKLVIRSCIQ